MMLSRLEAAHGEELKAFAKKSREEVKAARKEFGKKKAVEVDAQNQQLELDMAARHRDEIEEFEENGELPLAMLSIADEAEEAAPAAAAEEAVPELDEKVSKQEKARRKRERKVAKERTRDADIAEETLLLESTSEKKAESEAIAKQLAKSGLAVKDVAADGHCLYRALEDQLEEAGTYLSLRKRAASHIRENSSEFVGFLDLPVEEHCRRVGETAEWGGQPEILALTRELGRPIWVHSRDSPLLKMGEDQQGSPLQLTYHRHYYALGEHYNSTTHLAS